jgi:hypothetical protein
MIWFGSELWSYASSRGVLRMRRLLPFFTLNVQSKILHQKRYLICTDLITSILPAIVLAVNCQFLKDR